MRRPLLTLLAMVVALPALVAAEGDRCSEPGSQADHTVTSFDGTAIAVTAFRPQGACATDPRPVILTLHGWSGSRSTASDAADVAPFLDEGYGVVAIDARGHGESGGAALVHHPDREVKDFITVLDWIHDTLDWVERQPDSGEAKDIVAGAYGGSYGGGFQLMTAAFDDRLDALVPMVTWNSLPRALWPNRGAIRSDWLTLLYAAGKAKATLDPELDRWYQEGLRENAPPHEATHNFGLSSPATWIHRIDAPTLLIQGLPDTLFNLNEGVHNYVGLRDDGVDVRLVGINSGHMLPGLQPTSVAHSVRTEESPCADLPALVSDFLATHLRGDAAATDRLAAVPRVLIPTEQDTCLSGPDWPLTQDALTFTFPAIAAPEPGGSLLIPLKTADVEETLVGLPRLQGTPLQELDDQLYLSLVVADESGLHVIDDQVTGVRIRGAPCAAAVRTSSTTMGAACAAGTMAASYTAELGGIATTLRPGQQLFLRVDGWNEQHALTSTRRPGAALMTNVTLTVPVLGP